MCGTGDEDLVVSRDAPDEPVHHGVSRRTLLKGAAAAAIGASVMGPPTLVRAAPTRAAGLTGQNPLVAAMHVHAVYSEGPASWEQQYANAAAAGVDILWQTDHDFRARALNYMTLLNGNWLPSTTGSWRQHAATLSTSGPIRVLIESATTGQATQTLALDGNSTAINFFRTGIQGQTLTVRFGTSRLDAGARFEIVIALSIHPAQGGRARGQYFLRYRFLRGTTSARFTEGGGLTGVVRANMPANGTTLTLRPETDIRAIWPTMQAVDNCSFGMSFVAASPRSGVVADIRLNSVTVGRPNHDAASVAATQQAIATHYSSRYPVVGYSSEELSMTAAAIAHCNVFGAPPEWALKADVTTQNWRTYYSAYISRMRSRGAVVSYNHVMGFTAKPLLSLAEQDAKRRAQFQLRLADDFCGADVLEVGYTSRGEMPFSQHLAFWDTFSRRARFLTGNGASDDHAGNGWTGLNNGFLTGIWAASPGEADLAAALRSGRAFTYHPRNCPGLDIDTLTDGTVPMGKASVSSRNNRSMVIGVTNLPANCVVELVRGPVDYAGQDPLTSVVASFPRSAFGTAGMVTASVTTSTNCFIRPQVRQNGALVATGNPTWLLRATPSTGIPAARAA